MSRCMASLLVVAAVLLVVQASDSDTRSCLVHIADTSQQILAEKKNFNLNSFPDWDRAFSEAQARCGQNLALSQNPGYSCFRAFQTLIDKTKEFDNQIRSQSNSENKRNTFRRLIRDNTWIGSFNQGIESCQNAVNDFLGSGDNCENEISRDTVRNLNTFASNISLYASKAEAIIIAWIRNLQNCNESIF
eukprot:TRINITY_DN5915_c0_g1_i2.p1 TRINITY_DN5915_c0_g1~~TRINITY_DN5915_c0_g1_i2.p1  ORF type:complete len:190 (+),score=38.19 TRINITY_DN5915_c0_g1_i2:41-610(+)